MNTTNSKMNARLRQNGVAGTPPARRSDVLSATEEAAIQLQREEHEFKADLKDILKAAFMWKESPLERARNK